MKLNNSQLKKVSGGDLNASLINAISRGISTFIDLGRIIGSAVKRATSGKICSL